MSSLRIDDERKRFGIAVGISMAAHLALAMFIVFKPAEVKMPERQPSEVMDVMLIDPKSYKPERAGSLARTLANRTAKASNREATDSETRLARAPIVGQLPQTPEPTRPQQPSQPALPPQGSDARVRTLTRRGDDGLPTTLTPSKEPATQPRPTAPIRNLMPSTMALAELSRDFERERLLQQSLSREADIPVNTREAKYAPYAQGLVRSLEEHWRPSQQINYGTYMEKERRVLMRITIERSGELSNIEVLRSSPIPSLTESAVESIHASAPFKPLPSSWGMDRVTFYLTFEVVDDRFVFRTL